MPPSLGNRPLQKIKLKPEASASPFDLGMVIQKIWRANSDNPADSPWFHSGTMKSLMELPTVTAPPSPAPTPAVTAIETSVVVATVLEALMAIQLVALPPLMLA